MLITLQVHVHVSILNRTNQAKTAGNVIQSKNTYSKDSADKRRKWVQAFTGSQLPYVGRRWDNNSEFDLDLRKADFLSPNATTESAMVASINRGANALLDSSGT